MTLVQAHQGHLNNKELSLRTINNSIMGSHTVSNHPCNKVGPHRILLCNAALCQTRRCLAWLLMGICLEDHLGGVL
jgi:hypothetical protein